MQQRDWDKWGLVMAEEGDGTSRCIDKHNIERRLKTISIPLITGNKPSRPVWSSDRC
jgi:hypothetical protein